MNTIATFLKALLHQVNWTTLSKYLPALLDGELWMAYPLFWNNQKSIIYSCNLSIKKPVTFVIGFLNKT